MPDTHYPHTPYRLYAVEPQQQPHMVAFRFRVDETPWPYCITVRAWSPVGTRVSYDASTSDQNGNSWGVNDGDWVILRDGVVIDVQPDPSMFGVYRLTDAAITSNSLVDVFGDDYTDRYGGDDAADLRRDNHRAGDQEPR